MIGEIPTYEELMKRCLDRVPNTLDKRQGSIIYDAIAPIVAELTQMYIEIDSKLDLVFIDTSVGEYLDKKAEEIGLTRNTATKALRKGTFNILVPIGTRFSIEDVTYIVEGNIQGTEYRLLCEQAGSIGNEYYGDLTPVSYISGLTSAVLEDILIPGEDRETDEKLRERYINRVSQPGFGGNISDYIENTKEIDGIGGVKVFPVWNGGGTVKLVITDSNYEVPSSELVDLVQEKTDPSPQQMGLGTAPIGHLVTVEGAIPRESNYEVSISISLGYTLLSIKQEIENEIESYLEFLRTNWEKQNETIIRISQLESRIMAIEGIEDITNTKIDNSTSNLTLSEDELPYKGLVVVNEIT